MVILHVEYIRNTSKCDVITTILQVYERIVASGSTGLTYYLDIVRNYEIEYSHADALLRYDGCGEDEIISWCRCS